MQTALAEHATIPTITRIDHNDPKCKAALEAEGRLFAHYGLDYQVHFVELGEPNLRVRVLEAGQGQPLLMVPGGSGDAWIFSALMAELEGRRILTCTVLILFLGLNQQLPCQAKSTTSTIYLQWRIIMKKVLKWIGIILGVLVVLLIVAVVGLSIAGNAKIRQIREVQAEVINIPTDEAALARGEHLVHVACESCHGADLSGQALIDDPAIATLYAANITGLGQTHSDGEIVLAIRHGIDTDGRQLMIMPSESFIYFSEEDLGAIIGYLKTIPRVGEETPPLQPGPVGRILMGAGLFDSAFSASYIDHSLPFPTMPEVGANVAYGQYVSRFCQPCHGANLTGDQPSDPESPPAPNITATGGVGAWTEEQFIEFFHTGVNPFGEEADPAFMPWESFGKFEDDELRGLYMYLSSLSP